MKNENLNCYLVRVATALALDQVYFEQALSINELEWKYNQPGRFTQLVSITKATIKKDLSKSFLIIYPPE